MRTLVACLVVLAVAARAPSTTVTPVPPVKAKGSDPLYLIKEDKWGYMNRDGIVVIRPQFDTAADFFEGLAPASIGSTHGYINQSGQFEIFRPETDLGNFQNGLAWVGFYSDSVARNPRRLIDRAGNFLLDPGFAGMGPFSEGLALVSKAGEGSPPHVSTNAKYGFVDRTGFLAIPPMFDDAGEFSEGLAPVAMISGTHSIGRHVPMKWGFIDHRGIVVVPLEFDELKSPQYGVSIYWDTSIKRQGLIDRSGKVIVPARYHLIEDYGDGDKVQIFRASRFDNYDFLRPDGSVAFSLDDVQVNRFSEGLARIVKDERAGFINENGVVSIPLEFEGASDFSEGLAAAKKGSWGYIDKSGKWVIPPQFDGAKEFRDGLALVQTYMSWHYLDTLGRVVRFNVWTYPPCDIPAEQLEFRPLFCGY